VAWIALIAASIAACGDAPRSASDTGRESSITLRDATGREVTLARPARRIVSLAPNLTEILYAIGAGELVVGRTQFCNHPPEVASVPVVADMTAPNYERLVRLRPELLLMTFAGNSSAVYDRLRDLGLQPYALSAETIAGTLGVIDTVGRLVGRERDARAVVDGIERTLDSIAALTRGRARVSAFIVLDRAPLMTVSGGFINEALERAGGVNIAAGNPSAYPRYSREEVLRHDPEVIIVPGDSTATAEALLATFPEWKQLRAVRNGRVHGLSADILFRPGPRIAESVRILYDALHTR
jgi:ABC-type Fe3+-hydroxamate transport system substrate-binding protein